MSVSRIDCRKQANINLRSQCSLTLISRLSWKEIRFIVGLLFRFFLLLFFSSNEKLPYEMFIHQKRRGKQENNEGNQKVSVKLQKYNEIAPM